MKVKEVGPWAANFWKETKRGLWSEEWRTKVEQLVIIKAYSHAREQNHRSNNISKWDDMPHPLVQVEGDPLTSKPNNIYPPELETSHMLFNEVEYPPFSHA